MAAATKDLFDLLTLKYGYDYFPSIKQFVLRMPSVLHESVSSEVIAEILHQLKSIASYEDASAKFAQNIMPSGSGEVKFPDPVYGKHDPDASFRYRGTRYPGVVIEISYSKKRRDLSRLADDYILGSDGNIRVVIGLDVEYKCKMATLSVWRPRFSINEDGDEELEAEQTVVNQVCFYLRNLFLNMLTSVRDSVTKTVNLIQAQKQTSIFVLKILPQKSSLGVSRTYRVTSSSLPRTFVHTLTMPRLLTQQAIRRME
jgi:hypothetical protein